MRVALYQPDIPQNTGAIIRICACFHLPLDIIEPCGFILDDQKLKRSAMDYGPLVEIKRHISWGSFLDDKNQNSRLILLTTKGNNPLNKFEFQPDDILLFGRESGGVPKEVAELAAARVFIPMPGNTRSFNLAVSVGITSFQALSSINGL
ncbi:MAG: tRNA (cytidine(34)-2'-O)-methyltransferase [Alphaproteobacteria bacterium]